MTEHQHHLINAILNNRKAVKAFFIVFYLVGVVGTWWSYTSPLFFNLIPLALLLSFTALLIFHEAKVTRNTIVGFIAIYLLSFFIEVIGVNTGLIFGSYVYGNSLGIKLFGTPLLIGINWLFLVYTTSSVLEGFRMPVLAKIGLAAALMLIYDIVLEQIAPMLDMWHWENGLIPLQNYVAWFVLALLFQSLLKILNVKVQNKFAYFIIICQFMFFLFLLIANKLTI